MQHWIKVPLTWPIKQRVIAVIASAGAFLVIALPTAMISNPIFGRAIPTTQWAWPTLVVTSLLMGLLIASYFPGNETFADERPFQIGTVGGVFGFLAVGCPVCNKLALIALGYSGALNYFAPIQPFLALLGIGLLIYAIKIRFKSDKSCQISSNESSLQINLIGSTNGNH